MTISDFHARLNGGTPIDPDGGLLVALRRLSALPSPNALRAEENDSGGWIIWGGAEAATAG